MFSLEILNMASKLNLAVNYVLLFLNCIVVLSNLYSNGLKTTTFLNIYNQRTLLVVSACCASFYFLVLFYLMVRAVVSMSRKRASLGNVGRIRQLYYEVTSVNLLLCVCPCFCLSVCFFICLSFCLSQRLSACIKLLHYIFLFL